MEYDILVRMKYDFLLLYYKYLIHNCALLILLSNGLHVYSVRRQIDEEKCYKCVMKEIMTRYERKNAIYLHALVPKNFLNTTFRHAHIF